MTTLELKIQSLLKEKGSLSPLAIAKGVGLTTASDVNPTLYKMLNGKKVVKSCAEDGSSPRWQLIIHDPNHQTVDVTNNESLRKEILDILNIELQPISPSEIKKKLPSQITKSQINAVLYSLLNENLVTKSADANGRNPRWKI